MVVDSVEKVGSRSLKEIRLNDNAIFDLICLPPQIDYGRLGLTRSRAIRSPAAFPKDSAYDAEKILQCRRTDFFNRIGPERTSLFQKRLTLDLQKEIRMRQPGNDHSCASRIFSIWEI